MRKKKTIAIFTGNRAEYGLLYPVIKEIKNHQKLNYKLIVSGAHLDKNFGNTLNEIKKDGLKVTKEIKINMKGDALYDTTQAIGLSILEISNALKSIKPDILLVYADRFEGFSAVVAGSQMNIVTLHVEGGDITEGGALDDSIRHAMTKLSHIHFTTNKYAMNRILAMGEEKWRVKNYGFPGIDLIKEKKFSSKSEIVKILNINLDIPIVLFTQHSVTTEFEKAVRQIKPSLRAITRLLKKGIQVIITYPNNDAGGKEIIREIKVWKKNHKKFSNLIVSKSLGRDLYYGLLNLASSTKHKIVCMGNSSSGIKETAIFKCPTVNIGTRQKSRLRGQNVIDVDYKENEIYEAALKCLFSESFRKIANKTSNPYGTGNTGKKIAYFLSELKLNKQLLQKKMTIKGIKKNSWYR